MGVSVDLDDSTPGNGETYLSCLLLQQQQLIDRTLNIGLQKELAGFSASNSEFGMYLSESFSFRDQLVGVLREVLLGLQDGHDDDSGRVGDWWF